MHPPLGIHDIGGSLESGPIPYQPDEPPFHDDWERRVFGALMPVLRAAGSPPGHFRHTLERLSSHDYFAHGYYGRWLAALELLASEHGLVDPTPVQSETVRRAAPSRAPSEGSLVGPLEGELIEGRPARRRVASPPRFGAGDRVKIVAPTHDGHTRRAAYTIGKPGTVVELHPAEVLPDASAHRLDERAVWVYTVGFDAHELWGDEAEPNVTIMIDAYEPYLELL